MLYPTSVPVRDNRRSLIPTTTTTTNTNTTTNSATKPPVRDSTRSIKQAYRRMKKKKKERKKEETAQQRAVVKENEQQEDEEKRSGIKDLLCKTTHEELLKPYEFVGNPSIPPIAPPKPAGGFMKDGTPEMETPSDENRSPNSSYEQEGSSSEEDDLESGLVTAVKVYQKKHQKIIITPHTRLVAI